MGQVPKNPKPQLAIAFSGTQNQSEMEHIEPKTLISGPTNIRPITTYLSLTSNVILKPNLKRP